jgi:hypothetical protein
MFERGSLWQARKYADGLFCNFFVFFVGASYKYNFNCSGLGYYCLHRRNVPIFKQGLLCCDGKTKSCDTIPVIFGTDKESYRLNLIL